MARLRGMRGFSERVKMEVCGEWGCEVGWRVGWVVWYICLSILFLVLVSVLVDPAFFFLSFFWFLNLCDTSLWLLSTFANI